MKDSFKLIQESTEISSENLIGFQNKEEFNKTLSHLKNLILSSKSLIESNFFTQSLFLTITAIEEIAKIEVCIIRGFEKRKLSRRSKDPLFNHKQKHFMSANPIMLIGDRLQKSIGKERTKQIFKELQNGKFVKTRENCLYFQRNEEFLFLPNENVDDKLAFEMLLIAIDMVDDKFWGITSIASIISDELNEIYLIIEKEMNENYLQQRL
ncbi:MAG TPA: AbiV family abortive infection protein [Clostridia bacterium]|nr:AbiV family abortive infection protein [Clostridia bacterium]